MVSKVMQEECANRVRITVLCLCIFVVPCLAENVIEDEATQRKALNKEKFRCMGFTVLQLDNNTTDTRDIMTGATCGADAHSSGTPDLTFGFCEDDTSKCPLTWDDIMCWPPTDSGTMAVEPCPKYVAGFNYTQNATRMCMDDGTWYIKPGYNTSWTNFTDCNTKPITGGTVPLWIAKHMQDMRVMYNAGYGVSMASLVIAVFIMIYFKKLHCPRNTIHLNLFLSFICRGGVSFVKENILIESVGFSWDVKKEGTTVEFRSDVSHWECRLFFTIFNYIIAASYMWIFVEALYLQVLISVAVFSDKGRIKWYMALGWLFPLTFIIPWAIVRTTINNENCWNTYYDKPWLLWIIYGPITITIVINSCIFINIVRVLFTKLNSSPCPETKKFRYRRLAKSTLILIPLFGVYYIVFTYVTFGSFKDKNTIYLLSVEMFCNSFQGFILSLLFCFFNSEVQTELKKAWRRHSPQRADSFRTKASFLSRSSRSRNQNNDFPNGSIQCTDRVGPLELNTGANTIEEKVPFTSGVSTETVLDNHTDTVGNSVSKTDDVTPCLNNNHAVECQQTDFVTDDGYKGR